METSDITDLYRTRVSTSEYSRRNEIWKVLCTHFFQKFVGPTDTLVDLASGHGEFINHIDAGRKIAVDLNPDAAQHLGNEILFYNCSATELRKTLGVEADVVFTSNFFEHLPNKQVFEHVLDELNGVLKPNGRLLVLGPNLRFLPGEYWDYYDHELGLTDQSLSEALSLKGYLIELCLDRFVPYRIKGSGLPTHPWLVRMYLQVPLAWRVFGKEFFIVARRGPKITSADIANQR